MNNQIPLVETDIEEEEQNGVDFQNNDEENKHSGDQICEKSNKKSSQRIQLVTEQGEVEVKIGPGLRNYLKFGIPTLQLPLALQRFPRRMEVVVGSSFFSYFVAQKGVKSPLEVKVDNAKQAVFEEYQTKDITPSLKRIKEAGNFSDGEIGKLRRTGTIVISTALTNKKMPSDKRKKTYAKMYWNLNKPQMISAYFQYQNEKDFSINTVQVPVQENLDPNEFFAELLSLSSLNVVFQKIKKDDPKLPTITILQLMCLFEPQTFTKPFKFTEI